MMKGRTLGLFAAVILLVVMGAGVVCILPPPVPLFPPIPAMPILPGGPCCDGGISGSISGSVGATIYPNPCCNGGCCDGDVWIMSGAASGNSHYKVEYRGKGKDNFKYYYKDNGKHVKIEFKG